MPTTIFGYAMATYWCREEIAWSTSACPQFIVESLAAGVPVVTGDVGDRRAMVGQAGQIVPAGDAAALAEGICALLTQPPIDPAIIQTQAERYTWPTLVEDWLRSYAIP